MIGLAGPLCDHRMMRASVSAGTRKCQSMPPSLVGKMSAGLPNRKLCARERTTGKCLFAGEKLEAAGGVEPPIEILQS
jgi:hypothetical protein